MVLSKEVTKLKYYRPSGTEGLAELDKTNRICRKDPSAVPSSAAHKFKNLHTFHDRDHRASTRQTFYRHEWKSLNSGFSLSMPITVADNSPNVMVTHEQTNQEVEAKPHRFTGQELEFRLGLYYMGQRYYDPDLGRFLQVDPGRETWSSYLYALNNPVMGFDPDGNSTIFVHGTWSNPGVFSATFKSTMTGIFNDHEGPTFSWEGKNNNKSARSRAAVHLFEEIVRLHESGDTNINLVAHSHGGNVVFEASQLLHAYNTANGANVTINNSILIGTPIRDDYYPEMSVMNTLNIVSNNIDVVQRNGGYDHNSDLATKMTLWLTWRGGEHGDAVRSHSAANNIVLSVKAMSKYGVKFFDYAGAHSAPLDSPQLWNDIKPQLDIK